MNFSRFGHRFTHNSGTRQLMDDLGMVLRSPQKVINLGGGNPSVIPVMQQRFRQNLERLIASSDFDRLAAHYDDPQGHRPFLDAVAELLRAQYGWPVTHENLALTNGSQASFFMLFNLFGGSAASGTRRRILLPSCPEYIGYADVGLEPALLTSTRARIEKLDPHSFKYHIDFDAIEIDKEIAAVCVSRPTNPTGNVITNDELTRLVAMTARAGIPLIVDNAYGLPFPNIVFEPVDLVWDEHIILCFSLSKLGLPGLRTGIVLAAPPVVQALTSMNAAFMLANSALGASIALDLMRTGEIIELSRHSIQPYYHERSKQAIVWCHEYFSGFDYYIHKSEGAIFLWLWFPNLPISAQLLYERLKAKNILVIPGHHFGPGLAEDWQHLHECLRISYARPSEDVRMGIVAIAAEIRQALDESIANN